MLEEAEEPAEAGRPCKHRAERPQETLGIKPTTLLWSHCTTASPSMETVKWKIWKYLFTKPLNVCLFLKNRKYFKSNIFWFLTLTFHWVGRSGKMWPENVTGDWQGGRPGLWFFTPATHWWLEVTSCEWSSWFFFFHHCCSNRNIVDSAAMIWEKRSGNETVEFWKISKCFGTKRVEGLLRAPSCCVVFFLSCAFITSSAAAQVRSGFLSNPRILLQNNGSPNYNHCARWAS